MVETGSSLKRQAVPSAGSVLSEVAQEHRQIRELLGRMGRETHMAALGDLVHELIPLLRSHFADEEGPNGLYEELRIALPSRRHIMPRLMAEHAGFLTRLHGFETRIAEGVGTPGMLRAELATLIEQLSQHEQAERQLMTDADYVDLGAGD